MEVQLSLCVWGRSHKGYCANLIEAVDEKGWLGIFSGGLTASSAGITAAMLFGLAASAIFKPKDK